MRIHLLNTLVAAAILMSFSVAVAAQTKPAKPNKNVALIRAVLDEQAAAWNRGDVTGYMAGYENSPDIRFVSGDNVTRGWQTVSEHYHKRYDTRAKMGVLAFSELEITVLSSDSAVVVGKWELTREKDHPQGYFSLIFRKVKVGWRIVLDHTSSAS